MKKELYADDPYSQKLIDDLYKLQDEVGTIKALSRDELEKAKVEIGITKNISKRAERRQRKEAEKKKTPKKKSLQSLKKFINKKLNRIFEGQFTFHFDGKIITVIDVRNDHELEHMFINISSNSIHAPSSLTNRWLELFQFENRFINQIHMDKNFIKTYEPRKGEWGKADHKDKENAYGRADYNLMEGGFVDVPEETYRKFDMIPALLCSHEFVFTQEAVRGAGRGWGVEVGGKFLSLLMDYYEMEAKKYAHKR